MPVVPGSQAKVWYMPPRCPSPLTDRAGCPHAFPHGAVRRHGRSEVPAGPPPRRPPRPAAGRRPGRRGHRRGQHRRRPLGARAQGLSRPRHGDVHPRRRHRPRARVGTARRDVERQGGARGVRRGADLVRPRRPRHRHPPGAHPDARRRLPALRGDRGAVPALAAGRAPAADDRRPRRDARRDRRPREAQRPPGGALPGVLGAAARRGAGRGGARGRARGGHPAPGRASRRSPTPTWSWCRRPTRSSRSAPSSACPGSARRCAPRGARWSASPPSSAAPTCAGWPSSCSPRSASRSAPRRWAAHYGARSAGGILDGWLVDSIDADQVERVAAGGLALPRRPADDDRPDATAAMAAAASTWSGDAAGDRPAQVVAPDGVAEVRRGDDLAALLLRPRRPRGRRRRLVTSKVVSKAEGRVVHGDPRGRAGRRDRPGGGAPRPDRDRAHPPRADDGRRRRRRLQRRAGQRRPAARGPGRLRPARCATAVRADRRQRGRARHRHRRPGVARGPDRHRRRSGRAAVLDDHAGPADGYGNELAVTAPAVADELAGVAELAPASSAAGPSPWSAVAATSCCPRARTGPGAAALLRPEGADMFGLGAREAVAGALEAATGAAAAFGVAVGRRRARRRAGRVLGPADRVVRARRRGGGHLGAAEHPRRWRGGVRPRLAGRRGRRRAGRVSGCARPLRRLCATPPVPHARKPREHPWPSRQDRPPARGRRRRCAASRRRRAPARDDHRGVCVLVAVSASSPRPRSARSWTSRTAKFDSGEPRGRSAPRPRCARTSPPSPPTATSSTSPTGRRSPTPTPRPRSASTTDAGRDGPRSSTPPRTGPRSGRWCTTRSTATRSSGTTRPSPRTPTR